MLNTSRFQWADLGFKLRAVALPISEALNRTFALRRLHSSHRLGRFRPMGQVADGIVAAKCR